MGGQACVVYGAAEFSRDIDLALACDPSNLTRLRAALEDLQADCIAVPPLEARFLEAGHAVHFRCKHPEATNLRVDVMSRMRGVDDFGALWERRTTLEHIDIMSLPDLVKAKKTQRDKDWPMVSRLVEASFFRHRNDPSPEQLDFWFKELRNPLLLLELGQRFPARLQNLLALRPLLRLVEPDELQAALLEEERGEREADRIYWAPLRAELERLRHGR